MVLREAKMLSVGNYFFKKNEELVLVGREFHVTFWCMVSGAA